MILIQILSREHLLSALNVALVAASHDSLTTKTVHSEILWALNYSNNVSTSRKQKPDTLALLLTIAQISESIKRFGVGSSSSSLIVVRIGNVSSLKPTGPRLSAKDVAEMMVTAVDGQLTPLDKISQGTDMHLIKQVRDSTDPYISDARPSSAYISSQYYKLNSEPAILRFGAKNAKEFKDTPPRAILDEERRVIDEIVISSVAMKAVLA